MRGRHKNAHVYNNNQNNKRLEIYRSYKFKEKGLPLYFGDTNLKFGLLGPHLALKLDPETLTAGEIVDA